MIQNWSYSGRPSSSSKDAVRFLIGDTDPQDKQLDDNEIAFLLAEDGNIYEAAIQGCLGLAALYSRDVDEGTGKTNSSRSQRAQHYLDLAKRLKERRAGRAVAPYAGGISASEKTTAEEDTDRVSPAFTRTLMDAPVSRLDPISRSSDE